MNYWDRDGRFTEIVHKTVTHKIAVGKGYQASALAIMKSANVNEDRLSNWGNNHAHGMADIGELPANAHQAIRYEISARQSDAVKLARRGDYVGAAKALGKGLHTVQDYAAHNGADLVTHGGEAKNDNSKEKVAAAEDASQEFLAGFEAAIIRSVGVEKAEEIIKAVKSASEEKPASELKPLKKPVSGCAHKNCMVEPRDASPNAKAN